MKEVQSHGYDVFWITAKYGAFVNNQKISREKFFGMISEYGRDDTKKFIVLHYSILSEGISVPGLTSCIMMRQMNVIEMTQSVGRVLRLHYDDIKGIESGQIIPGDVSPIEVLWSCPSACLQQCWHCYCPTIGVHCPDHL